MESLSKEYILSFYDRQLMMHGDRPEALRWTPNGQKSRYSLMLEVTPSLEGKKVLDYGCGKGDFYGFLKKNNINTDYTGMDINPNLIELARLKYPECTFRVFDVEEESLDDVFDYIFLCGVFNNKIEDATETMKKVVAALFKHTREGLAVSATSSYDPKKDKEINYVLPEEFLNFSLSYLSPFVSLRHDRVPYDFTTFIYKNPTGTETTIDARKT